MAYSEGRNRNLYPGQARYPVRRARIKVPPRMLRASDMVRRGPRSGPWLYAFLGLLLVMLLIPTVALGAGAVYYINTAASLQGRLDKLASYHERAFQTSRIFDRNGTLLYEFVNAGRRDPVKLDQVADLLKDATIA